MKIEQLCENLGNVTSVLFFCKHHSYSTVFLLEKTFVQEWSAKLTSAGALITRTTAGFEEYGIRPNQKQGPRYPNRISDTVKVLGQWNTSLPWLSLWWLHKWVVLTYGDNSTFYLLLCGRRLVFRQNIYRKFLPIAFNP